MYAASLLQAIVVSLLSLRQVAAARKAPTWYDQSWFFAWDPPGARLPTPTTAQCETIHITWSRQTATGPDPVAPYFLRIFTSNFVFPFVVPAGSNPETYFTVPFAPGTQYEICMFDSNGSTGGCQAVYTVYPNTTTSTPTCANLTMPARTLNVQSEYSHGTLSQYGWVDSCSDIRVTPQEGTPPFTFTVAPALHPPLNITSNDMSPINWTVALTWASPFFISLVDSTGLSWSNGPIHSGKGTEDCFAKSRSTFSTATTVGAAVGGAAAGALASLVIAFLISKRRNDYGDDRKPIPFYSRSSPHAENHDLGPGRDSSGTNQSASPRYHRLPSLSATLHEFHVEPFVLSPSQRLPSHSGGAGDSMAAHATQQSLTDGSDARTHIVSPTTSTTSARQEAGNQVYVIHHDSGGAPVSVVTAHGTQVVELPPGYSSSYSSGTSTGGPGSSAVAAPRRQGKFGAGTAGDAWRG